MSDACRPGIGWPFATVLYCYDRRLGLFIDRMLVPRVIKLPPTMRRRTGSPVFGS